MKNKSQVFTPIKIGTKVAKNRIEVSPAGSFISGKNGDVNHEFLAYMNHLAKSNAGIVTVGVSDISGKPSGVPILDINNKLMISDLCDVTEVIHRHGSLANIELVHGYYMLVPGEKLVNDLTTEQVEELIQMYVDSAENCLIAGFDMIMIHGAHGNVPSMFFSRKYNHRTDRFGNRHQFGKELLQQIRNRVGDKLAIEYRISGEEILDGYSTLDETIEYAKAIEEYVDLFHVSRGLLEKNECLPYLFMPTYFPRGMNLNAAKQMKKALNKPVAVVGGFDMDKAMEVIDNGDVDVVAMIRNIYADPNCIINAQNNKSNLTRPCVRCNNCINRTHSKMIKVQCAVNPTLGKETQFPPIYPIKTDKKVMIVGGGPAGMEVARVASKKGYQVLLYEKDATLGGALKMASGASFKQDMKKYLEWSIRSIENDSNITIYTNTIVTPELIKEINPYALFIAIGSNPILPTFSHMENVVYAGDVDLKKVSVKDNVVIIGAGFTGLETALELAREGKNVTVIDRLRKEEIGADSVEISMIGLKQLLKKEHVKFICEVSLKDVSENGAIITYKDGHEELLSCDTVVLSLGVKPDLEKIEELDGIVDITRIIGDCSIEHGGTLYHAVHSGYENAMEYL